MKRHGLAIVGGAVAASMAAGIGFGLAPYRHHPHPAGLVGRNPAGGTLLSIACPGKRQCEAVGDDETQFGPRKELGEWSGGQWQIQVKRGSKRQVGDLLNAVSCPSSQMCVAVGTYYLRSGVAVPLAQVMSHSRWQVDAVPSPPARGGSGSRLTGLSCPSATDCEAVGFDQTRSGTAALAEQWNGARWRIQPTPSSRASSLLSRVSCATPRACTAIGTVITTSGAQVPFAERWNGATWQVQATARVKSSSGSVLTGISCPAVKFCLAVGGYVNSDRTLAETWYGLGWRTQPTPSPAGRVASTLADVFCRSPRMCTAIGYSQPGYHGYTTLIEAWNGTSWQIQASPDRGRVSDLFSVSCPAPRECLAVGDYSTRLGLRRTLVETWFGKGWRIAP